MSQEAVVVCTAGRYLRVMILTPLIFAFAAFAPTGEDPLVLRPVAKLGPGANKEVSGIVKSRTRPGVFWTLNDSGDEPRVYPVRADGAVIPSVRYPETPGVLIGDAINSDWEDLAVDASGRLIVADFGNNTNARRDLVLYVLPEPEGDEGRTATQSKIFFRYPDQTAFPAPEPDRNFDAEAIFTVGDEIYILSKNRSDTFTKLYRVDDRKPGETNVLSYIDRFDVAGKATGADATEDGLKLAVLTYDRIWLFERTDVHTPFFAGRVSCRPYRMHDGDSDSEAICFETPDTLLIADEARGEMYRVPLTELREVKAAPAVVQGRVEHDLKVMSLNVRFDTSDDGVNAWPKRADEVARTLRAADADLIGFQEVLSQQADWLRETLSGYGFCGVGRQDGVRKGEFVPIVYREERFTLLSSGHFWLSDTPDVPGSRGWDGACERMATWVRLFDRRTKRAVFVLNTHLDHVGAEARTRGLKMVRSQIDRLAEGAAVIVTGDFNAPGDGPLATVLTGPGTSAAEAGLVDSFRAVYPTPDLDEGTFSGWTGRIQGDRIDWILSDRSLAAVDASIERRMPAGRTVSDHFPVTARLRYRP